MSEAFVDTAHRPYDHITVPGETEYSLYRSSCLWYVPYHRGMILHIINAAKSKDVEGTWFDANGVAGLVFYLAVVVTIVLFMTGNPLPGGIVMGVMFGVPLLLIFLKEPARPQD